MTRLLHTYLPGGIRMALPLHISIRYIELPFLLLLLLLQSAGNDQMRHVSLPLLLLGSVFSE